jgi:hypothetical protein
MRSMHVAYLNLVIQLSICLKTQKNLDNRCRDGSPVGGTTGWLLTLSQQCEKQTLKFPVSLTRARVCLSLCLYVCLCVCVCVCVCVVALFVNRVT